MFIDRQELVADFDKAFAGVAGYYPADAKAVVDHLVALETFGHNPEDYQAAVPTPSPTQQACYAVCQQQKVDALAAAAAAGFPAGWILAAKAVLDFNSCRAACDRQGG